MKMKRRKGLRVPGIRNRLNGDDSWGLYALMDWYCQGHLTQEDVLERCKKYAFHLQNLLQAWDEGRKSDNHYTQIRRAEHKFQTLALVLRDWEKRKFSS